MDRPAWKFCPRTQRTPEGVTPDQRECLDLLATLFLGQHHLYGKASACGPGVRYVCHAGNFATYDGSALTGLVVLAHDRCIRAEILPAGTMLAVLLHKRAIREGGGVWDRHPTLESATAAWRTRWGL